MNTADALIETRARAIVAGRLTLDPDDHATDAALARVEYAGDLAYQRGMLDAAASGRDLADFECEHGRLLGDPGEPCACHARTLTWPTVHAVAPDLEEVAA
jgi:hypothetical protein